MTTLSTLSIRILKAKATLEVDIHTLPEPVWTEVVIQGLQALLNRGQAKIAPHNFPPDQIKTESLAAAKRQLELLKTGKIRLSRQPSPGRTK